MESAIKSCRGPGRPGIRLLVALMVVTGAGRSMSGTPPAEQSGESPMRHDWEEVERLQDEDKLAEALAIVEEILEQAVGAGDEPTWARALVRAAQLRIALGQFESAVRLLQERPWPRTAALRPVLQLSYANALQWYLQAYSWDIEGRQRLDTGEEVDIRLWTRDQIYEAAQQAFYEVWQARQSLTEEALSELSQYLDGNTYPPRIRGTYRDVITYLWVELLANSHWWHPREINQVHALDRSFLIAPLEARKTTANPGDESLHPLLRIAALLADLEAWHRGEGRPEAAFEAQRERLQILHAAMTGPEDRAHVRRALERAMEQLTPRYPWWSMGQATLAEMVQGSDAADALIRAREIADAGVRAHPESIGGQRCRYLVSAIEAPVYQLSAMILDGPERRSIQVQHKNLARIHLRAYRLDPLEWIASSQDYDLLPGYRDVEEIVGGRPAAAEWTVELPPTPDFRIHQSYITPPFQAAGLYVVVASADPDFGEAKNRLAAVNLLISDLVLTTRSLERTIEVEVRSGGSGQAIGDVDLWLYRYDYQQGHQRIAGRRSDNRGRAVFRQAAGRRGRYFVVAERGQEIGLETATLRWPEPESQERSSTLVYTDRSVYRPGQRIQWKIVAYRFAGEEGSRVLPGRKVQVDLIDAQQQVVAGLEVETNSFGTASGQFSVPPGRLLGRWSLRSSLGGTAVIQIEEYKRPTFEVSILEPASPMRLNRPATLRGEARYYFGQPVVEGEVEWQVERVPMLPRWTWFGEPPTAETEMIASGVARTDADGRFELTFLATADERLATEGTEGYEFRLRLDLVDEGGETRSAERRFRLGFVAVRAAIDVERGFFLAGEQMSIGLERTDLDGVARAGEGEWELLRVQVPEGAFLPADLPLPLGSDTAPEFATAGDRVRPRWATDLDPERVLSSWPAGESAAHGSVVHGDDGVTRIDIVSPGRGLYRFLYRTRDEFGGVFEVSRDLLVTSDGAEPIPLPAFLAVENETVAVGGVARLLVSSGLANQPLVLEIFRRGTSPERREIDSSSGVRILEIPIGQAERGSVVFRLSALRDHQSMVLSETVLVPWDDRQLQITFGTFRDLLRPGQRERWRVQVAGAEGEALEAGAAEVLAYMYDRSLDLFAPHRPPDPVALYPVRVSVPPLQVSLGGRAEIWSRDTDFAPLPRYPQLQGDRLVFFEQYGIGGPGPRGGEVLLAAAAATARGADRLQEDALADPRPEGPEPAPSPEPAGSEIPGSEVTESVRRDFRETAFWEPHLLVAEDGSVVFEFTVPDSVSEWNVWVHAVTRDLKGGSLAARARTSKDLLVRPYLPRFLREGDRARLRVQLSNSAAEDLTGTLDLAISEPASGESLLAEFGLAADEVTSVPFSVPARGSSILVFDLQAPVRVGQVAVEVQGRAGGWSDAELHSLALLPGRMHLSQSRFVALQGEDRREMHFADMQADDPTLLQEQLVVSLDAQLFQGVLRALPYLVRFPYECTEQTLNRFLSTGIVTSLFDEYPAIARLAKELSRRDTRFEAWDEADPRRDLALEETPWLQAAAGGQESAGDLIRVLDPRLAAAERESALARLEKAQTALGAFPWWPGGPPSPYMTLYLLQGFSRALEFGIEVPRPLVTAAWDYMHRHYLDEIARTMMEDECCWELVTFLNYVLSSYADDSWTGGIFSEADRDRMLEYSFRNWRRHSPLLKSYLALTLWRRDRPSDARLVFDSVMDSARTTRDEGTFWAPEERSWLWYQDTIDSHAFALRTLMEIDPEDERRHGLVQWLFLNKKLNHWKSTRATAEVIYALAHYLEREGTLGENQVATVEIGARQRTFVFDAQSYSDSAGRWLVPGEDISPLADARVVVENQTPGLMFASATWHFSTEQMPPAASGDFFSVERRFFRRRAAEDGWVLEPLTDGDRLEIGDQVEVQLSVRARHAAEYVHVRDPRAAGLEPVATTSRYRWELGLGWYEEVRDSGTNFFFDWIPAGEYTLSYRLRVAMAGRFRMAPAIMQSMYAPEFSAYSAGREIVVGDQTVSGWREAAEPAR